jgi:hypothetical protein
VRLSVANHWADQLGIGWSAFVQSVVDFLDGLVRVKIKVGPRRVRFIPFVVRLCAPASVVFVIAVVREKVPVVVTFWMVYARDGSNLNHGTILELRIGKLAAVTLVELEETLTATFFVRLCPGWTDAGFTLRADAAVREQVAFEFLGAHFVQRARWAVFWY